jgi:hypothetical protein
MAPKGFTILKTAAVTDKIKGIISPEVRDEISYIRLLRQYFLHLCYYFLHH